MSDKQKMNALIGAVAHWARARGKPRPKTKEGWAALMAQFMAEQPAWHEIPDAHETHLTYDGATTQIVDARHGPKSDFDEMLDQRDEAMAEAGGDDLTRDALLLQGDHAELSKEAAFTRNAPPSIVGAVLGGTAAVTSGGQTQTVANWQGRDEEATSVSIVFAMQPPPTTFGAFDVKPFARIRFGNRGIVAQVDCDIAQGGSQLTLDASSVAVDVGVDAAVAPQNPCTLQLSAMLGFGAVVRTTPLTRTVYIDGAALINTGGLGIPAFAKKVWLFRSNLTEAITMQFQNSGLQNLYQFVLAANANMTDSIPLSNDCTLITLSGGGGLSKARLIFELGL